MLNINKLETLIREKGWSNVYFSNIYPISLEYRLIIYLGKRTKKKGPPPKLGTSYMERKLGYCNGSGRQVLKFKRLF
jgi:hypothetical protein